jgi:hypothetical protein
VNLTVPLNIEVNGVPQDSDTPPSITIVDNTTSTTVVTAAAPTAHPTTGQYSYTYAAAVAGHTYTSTWSVTVNGAAYTTATVTYVPATGPLTGTGDDGTSGFISGQWTAMRATWEQIHVGAAVALYAALVAGPGANYSISDPTGSQSVSWEGFQRAMTDIMRTAVEMTIRLTELLQDVNPFNERYSAGRRRWS